MSKVNEMTRLSPHFLVKEFKVSDSYPQLAAQIKVSPYEAYKMKALCHLILEPVRDHVNARPIKILSGKRSEELNEKIGGSDMSHHLYQGEKAAVDFTIPGADLADVYAWMLLNVPFAELFYYPNRRFIHVSLPTQDKIGINKIMG